MPANGRCDLTWRLKSTGNVLWRRNKSFTHHGDGPRHQRINSVICNSEKGERKELEETCKG